MKVALNLRVTSKAISPAFTGTPWVAVQRERGKTRFPGMLVIKVGYTTETLRLLRPRETALVSPPSSLLSLRTVYIYTIQLLTCIRAACPASVRRVERAY